MDIHTQLKKIGLSRSEIEIYTYLLEHGISSPPQIAKTTKIARTNCYNILASLKEKSLINEQLHGKRKTYLANDPQALLKNLEAKKEAVERLLPDLRALYTTQKNKPKIKFYEGFEQVKEIYWQTSTAPEVYAIGSTKHLDAIDPQFFAHFLKELKHTGVILHDILGAGSKQKNLVQAQNILKGLYSAEVVSEKYPDFATDILIWEHNIALITLEEPIFGTVLTNPLLAQTFKTIFKIMNDGLKKYSR
ncbi:MAG: hypothetical protein HYV41_04955 [Candidatus Magasanikbacteria bacterium]|nr:hypothetical protein [Candidatus Magasanikbacteria bacterium]